MKHTTLVLASVFIAVIGFGTWASALEIDASLTHIYDFSYLDVTKTSFEGLDFTTDKTSGDVTLWITSSTTKQMFGQEVPYMQQLLGVDLVNSKVVENFSYNQWKGSFNPVGLASDGENLFITNNLKGVGGLYEDLSKPDGAVTYLAGIDSTVCKEPEGSAFLNGFVYVSCEDTKNVVKIDPKTGAMENIMNFDYNPLGLGATENALIVGDNTNHLLRLYDVVSGVELGNINLADLFVGANSDYTKLEGKEYGVDVTKDDHRNIPDPDGIAYRNGKIYMTFEHDLRVYEIGLPAVSTPEPGTLLLLGAGLIGLSALKKKRA